MDLDFNTARDHRYAYKDDRFKRTLHIFDAHWHGIRSATGAFPGQKLAISHKNRPSVEGLKHITGLIFHHGINRVCFQGYSELADQIARHIHSQFGDSVPLFVIGHVNSAQLEYFFEMDMQARIALAFKEGLFKRVGSVKPQFDLVFPGCFKKTIINFAPNNPFQGSKPTATEPGTVFLPLETGWRKNLWTNTIAALHSAETKKLYTVNWPKGLDALHDLSRVQQTGFLDRTMMFDQIARAEIVMSVTLAECQPMTQLEALAVGTPALMGPLDIPELHNPADEWNSLVEVSPCDTPSPLIKALGRLRSVMKSDPKAVTEMMESHLSKRTQIGLDILSEFLYV